jgi:hypothetical protein
VRVWHDNGLTEERCPHCNWKLRWAWTSGRKYLACDTKGCGYKSRETTVESLYTTRPWELDWNL